MRAGECRPLARAFFYAGGVMRRGNGLMGFSLIGGSCPEVGVLNPSILKTERPRRHPRSINLVAGLKDYPSGRSAFSRGSGFVLRPISDRPKGTTSRIGRVG